MRPSFPWRSPAVAAVLSFLFPGLGQAAAGQPRRGAIVAIPSLSLVAAVVAVAVYARHDLLGTLLSRDWLTSLLIVDLIALAYHLWAVADAYKLARPAAPSKRREPGAWATIGVLSLVVVATVGVHLSFGVIVLKSQQAVSCAFNPGAPCGWENGGNLAVGQTLLPAESIPPDSTPSAGTSGGQASQGPSPSQVVYNPPTGSASSGTAADWANDGYLNILLIGADEGVGRGTASQWDLRTDTMILLQVKIATGQAAMYGIPRNLFNVPLPPASAGSYACRCFDGFYGDPALGGNDMLNALWRAAVMNPKQFPYPGTDFQRGTYALEGAIGALTGVHVDGTVLINLMGFVNLVDALGGLSIDVPYAIYDPNYPKADGSGDTVVNIAPGLQKMDGITALEFARSRHQADDFQRMERQQLVIKAVRQQFAHPCSLIPRMGDILDAIGQVGGLVWTDMPESAAPQLAALAGQISGGNVQSYVFGPSNGYYEYVDQAMVSKIHNQVAHGLDGVPVGSGSSGGGGGGGLSC
jgi:LCP family protein required for cell wall assembly